MENQLKFIGEHIVDKKYEIAMQVHENRLAGVSAIEREAITPIEKDIIDIRANYIGIYGEILIDQLSQEEAFERMFTWGKETGDYIYKLGVPLDEALIDTSYYRTFIWSAIEQLIRDNNMNLDIVFKVLSIIDPLMDNAVYSFSLTYVKSYQLTLETANSAFLELSVPVVPLTKGVAILPVIGNIDTERARLLMEQTLEEATRQNLSYLLFDLSGVLIVDTMVANQIFRIINALSLVGVHTVLTGIRPEVAQTMVSLGIDIKGLMIKKNLEQAFSYVMGQQ
jgi:rsbT co-antagonist protein RsbR